jgi:Tfp pilus assembly protein PilN
MPAKHGAINLLGDSDLEHTPLGRIVAWAVTYGRYIMIGTEIVVLLAFISRFSLDRKLTDLKEEISQKQDIIQANLLFERDIRRLQDKLGKIQKLTASTVTPLDTLQFFQSIIPNGVYFRSYNHEGNRITIQANAGSTDSFTQFLANMQASKLIANVEIGEVTRDPVMGIQFAFTAGVVNTKKN